MIKRYKQKDKINGLWSVTVSENGQSPFEPKGLCDLRFSDDFLTEKTFFYGSGSDFSTRIFFADSQSKWQNKRDNQIIEHTLDNKGSYKTIWFAIRVFRFAEYS